MAEKIKPAVVKALLKSYGGALGSDLIVVKKVPWDKKYDERQKREALNLTKKFYMYETVVIPIRSAEIIGRDANDYSFVMFNKDPKLQMPILDITSTKEVLPDPTPETVRDCVNGKSNKWGVNYMFTDLEKVVDIVQQLNKSVETRIRTFIEEMFGNLGAFETTNRLERSKVEDAANGITLFNSLFSSQDVVFVKNANDDLIDVSE